MKKCLFIALFFSVQSFCVGVFSLKKLCLKAIIVKIDDPCLLLPYREILEGVAGRQEDHESKVSWIRFLYLLQSSQLSNITNPSPQSYLSREIEKKVVPKQQGHIRCYVDYLNGLNQVKEKDGTQRKKNY